jgi:hypothetical protein
MNRAVVGLGSLLVMLSISQLKGSNQRDGGVRCTLSHILTQARWYVKDTNPGHGFHRRRRTADTGVRDSRQGRPHYQRAAAKPAHLHHIFRGCPLWTVMSTTELPRTFATFSNVLYNSLTVMSSTCTCHCH